MTGTATRKRRTQAERRAESRQAVLESATRLFGEQGYAATSLDEIAADCGLTIRPIYHYFGNKKALFAAVNEVMEQRILDSMEAAGEGGGLLANWHAYLELCDDPHFRRIVLIDSPNVLGRERWASGPVMTKARASLASAEGYNQATRFRAELINAVMMGAFTEAALIVAEADDIALAKREAEGLMKALFSRLLAHTRRGRGGKE